MNLANIKVLYLAGTGRSGSTLLGRLLGEPEEAVHVGELVYLWRRSFQEQHVCGCGAPFFQCPFWKEVFERGFGGFGNVDYEEILETKRQMERTRTLPRLLSPWKTKAQRGRLEQYRQVLAVLYRAIAETSGASVIIDGSKSEAYGYLLETVPGLDLRSLHLVRDSRAVAHSHQRRKSDPAPNDGAATLPTMPPSQAALRWAATNLLLNLRMPGKAHRFLRYEDMIADPDTALRRLWGLMDEPAPSLDFLNSSPIYLRTNHTVAGNPDRFQSEVTIRPDSEWEQKMSVHDRRLVTALTLPGLLQYQFLRSPEAASWKRIRPSRVL